MAKKEDKVNENGYYPVSKEGVIESIRNQIVPREILISTMFGLTVVIGMRIMDNLPSMMGLILGVFLTYYMLTVRRGKLEGLGLGNYMYYTPELNRQVIKVTHYDQVGIKQYLFSFGVVNIIYLQLLGLLLMNEATTGNMKVRLIITVVGIGVYLLAFNQAIKRYSHKIGKELSYVVEERNQGISITLTQEEKELVKDLHGISDRELQGGNIKGTQDLSLGYELEEGGIQEEEDTPEVVEELEPVVEPEVVEPEVVVEEPEESEEKAEGEVETIPEITVQQFIEGVTEVVPYRKEVRKEEVTDLNYVEGETKIKPYLIEEVKETEDDVSTSKELTETEEIPAEEDLEDIFGIIHVLSDVEDMRVTNGIGKK